MKVCGALVHIVALGFVLLGAGSTKAQDLGGAWSLQEYEMMGDEQRDVSGLLIMADGRFALIYTMHPESGLLSGRGHGGRYTVQQDQLIFDVEWSLEDVNGVARATAPGREVALTSRDGDSLALRFGSGSVQRWRHLDFGNQADVPGAWQLQNVLTNDLRHKAQGAFILAADRFALIYAMEGNGDSSDLYAYGGASRSDSDRLELTTEWTVTFVDGDGSVSNAERPMTLTFPSPESASLSGPAGERLELRR